MGPRQRMIRRDTVRQDGCQPGPVQLPVMHPLVVEQRQLRHEADVGQAQRAAGNEAGSAGERPLDAAQVVREGLLRGGVQAGGHRLRSQGQHVELGVAREQQAGVQEAVDARRGVGVAAVERHAAVAEPGDRAQDAVGFEDADLPTRVEGGRHGAERVRGEEGIGLVERAGEAGAPGAHAVPQRVAFLDGQRVGIEIPQPVLQLLHRRAAHLEAHAAQPRGDRRLGDARIGQVGKDAQDAHGGRLRRLRRRALLRWAQNDSLYGRRSISCAHAVRGWRWSCQ